MQLIIAYQHFIIILYIALEQPGGGGSLYPLSIFSIVWLTQTQCSYNFCMSFSLTASYALIAN